MMDAYSNPVEELRQRLKERGKVLQRAREAALGWVRHAEGITYAEAVQERLIRDIDAELAKGTDA